MIKFYVNEQNIELKINRIIASDTIDFVKLDFVFCESWDGYNKTVQFTQKTNTYSVNLGVNETTCYLPNEITDGLCAISVFGNKGDKRATTVPCQVRIKRSGFMEDSIIPSDTPITVIEQLIQDTGELKEDVDKLKNDVSDLKESVAAIPNSNPNRLAESFDLDFGKGYHTGELDIYYDKATNKLTLNGTVTKDSTLGGLEKTFLEMGCYEFVNCKSGNIFTGTTSALPFKLSLTAQINENAGLGNYAIITDKATAAAEPDTYNKLNRDCFVKMELSIPAGSSFDNEEFYPWLMRYSAYVEE